jgi:hypothetical protein
VELSISATTPEAAFAVRLHNVSAETILVCKQDFATSMEVLTLRIVRDLQTVEPRRARYTNYVLDPLKSIAVLAPGESIGGTLRLSNPDKTYELPPGRYEVVAEYSCPFGDADITPGLKGMGRIGQMTATSNPVTLVINR